MRRVRPESWERQARYAAVGALRSESADENRGRLSPFCRGLVICRSVPAVGSKSNTPGTSRFRSRRAGHGGSCPDVKSGTEGSPSREPAASALVADLGGPHEKLQPVDGWIRSLEGMVSMLYAPRRAALLRFQPASRPTWRPCAHTTRGRVGLRARHALSDGWIRSLEGMVWMLSAQAHLLRILAAHTKSCSLSKVQNIAGSCVGLENGKRLRLPANGTEEGMSKIFTRPISRSAGRRQRLMWSMCAVWSL
jgi:hypothetical protein